MLVPERIALDVSNAITGAIKQKYIVAAAPK